MLDALFRDARNGLRSLLAEPHFVAAAVISFGLTAGVCFTMFAVTYTVYLKPLAIPDPSRVVLVRTEAGPYRHPVGLPALRSLAAARGVQSLGAINQYLARVRGPEAEEFGWVHAATGDLFEVLALRPLLGRGISRVDEESRAPVVVLSWRTWARLFDRDSTAIGRVVNIGGAPFTVIGILPRTFEGVYVGQKFSGVIPAAAGPAAGLPEASTFPVGDIFARLQPGDPARAASSLTAALRRCCSKQQSLTHLVGPAGGERADRAEALHVVLIDAERGVSAVAGAPRDRFHSTITMLFVGAVALFLIGCVNIANLNVVRIVRRTNEFAVRGALGASSTDVVRQVLVEAAEVAALGVWTAVGVAWVCAAALSRIPLFNAPGLQGALGLQWNATTVVFVIGVFFVGLLGIGVLPAWRATQISVTGSPGAQGLLQARFQGGWQAPWPAGWRPLGGAARVRRTRVTTVRWKWSDVAAVAQVALTTALLWVSVLIALSLADLRAFNAGYSSGPVVLADLDARGTDYDNTGFPRTRLDNLRRALEALPGVNGVALATTAPLLWHPAFTVQVLNADGTVRGEPPRAHVGFAASGFVRTSGLRLVSGRDFDARDESAGLDVAIVNQSFVRWFLNGGDAVGATFIAAAHGSRQAIRVVGVVQDAPLSDIRTSPPPMYYQPMARLWAVIRQPGPSELVIAVRSGSAARSQVAAVQAAIRQAIPGVRIESIGSARDIVRAALSRERVAAWVGGLFGACALILGMLGLYGTIGYDLAGRRREIAIRLALGATPGGIMRRVIGGAAVRTLVGLAVGVPLSLVAAHALRSQLWGIGAYDPRPLVGALILLLGSAVLASWRPAHQVAQAPPCRFLGVD